MCRRARSATNQTAASVCLGSVGDTYFFGGLVFDALIKAPNLDITKVADHTTANPGDVVNYTTTVTNPSMRDPSDPLFNTPVSAATNLVVADQLPSGLDFVNFTNDGGGRCSYAATRRCPDDHLHRGNARSPTRTFTYSYKATVDRPPHRAQHPAAARQQRLLRRQLRGPAGRPVHTAAIRRP